MPTTRFLLKNLNADYNRCLSGTGTEKSVTEAMKPAEERVEFENVPGGTETDSDRSEGVLGGH